jgi:hypothetical protein
MESRRREVHEASKCELEHEPGCSAEDRLSVWHKWSEPDQAWIITCGLRYRPIPVFPLIKPGVVH